MHHALCNIIEPIFERGFIYDSYANRVGKGTHRALDRAQQFARQHRYVLQCDVRQFFPIIDHATLRGILAHKVADDGVLWLIDRILASGVGLLSGEYEMQWTATGTIRTTRTTTLGFGWSPTTFYFPASNATGRVETRAEAKRKTA